MIRVPARNRSPRSFANRSAQLPNIPDLRAVLTVRPGTVFTEIDVGNTFTPAAIGGPVGRVKCPVSGIFWDAPTDAARPTLRVSSRGVWYLEFDGVNHQLRLVLATERRTVLNSNRMWAVTGTRRSGTAGTFAAIGSTTANTGWVLSIGSTVSFTRQGGGVYENQGTTPVIQNGQVVRTIFGHNSTGVGPSLIDGSLNVRSLNSCYTPAITAANATFLGSRSSTQYAAVNIAAAVIAGCSPTPENVAELDRWMAPYSIM